jgi:hypothetical protein
MRREALEGVHGDRARTPQPATTRPGGVQVEVVAVLEEVVGPGMAAVESAGAPVSRHRMLRANNWPSLRTSRWCAWLPTRPMGRSPSA